MGHLDKQYTSINRTPGAVQIENQDTGLTGMQMKNRDKRQIYDDNISYKEGEI